MLDNFEQYIVALDDEVDSILGMWSSRLPSYYGMMKYQLGSVDEHLVERVQNRGKRIRALLCLLTHEAITDSWTVALPLAAAIELVHNFSVIHDDIQDNSPERRHRPTVWKLWGKPQAINAGDGMHVLAYLALLTLRDKGVEEAKILKLITVLSETCLSIAEGQYLDIDFENRAYVSIADYLKMVSGKTAALIATSTQLGAMLAGADEGLVSHYSQFGYNLGLTFQIIDDILGIWGDPEVTGKPVADDIVACKKTLPVVYALEKDKSGQLDKLYQRGSLEAEEVQAVMNILDRAGAQAYAEQLATEYYGQAATELNATGLDTPAQHQLRTLAKFLVERDF